MIDLSRHKHCHHHSTPHMLKALSLASQKGNSSSAKLHVGQSITYTRQSHSSCDGTSYLQNLSRLSWLSLAIVVHLQACWQEPIILKVSKVFPCLGSVAWWTYKNHVQCPNYGVVPQIAYSKFSLSIHWIVLTQRDHCSENAVVFYQWHCAYIECPYNKESLLYNAICSDSMSGRSMPPSGCSVHAETSFATLRTEISSQFVHGWKTIHWRALFHSKCVINEQGQTWP